jgi:hypothetical protein
MNKKNPAFSFKNKPENVPFYIFKINTKTPLLSAIDNFRFCDKIQEYGKNGRYCLFLLKLAVRELHYETDF